ncbi:hypothetical protein ACFP9V_24010 [Deinococcus radiopugnans]|uniref:Uncharacterized protein n=1 Tax=Deinococcus radiopugnans ATCC 19172 TaxID=585398 RepID=A0A5C4XI58_9DEIO|nr:hypothetical protein [Deinococcus radiopugnans]MBB6018833.1 hypothetical protein [Deinococcus radiopugnans ATCC 19172]TNM63215.1 hypothetical protein FHR04_20205 [Deinococcus radiopugnans ATCC 19172]
MLTFSEHVRNKSPETQRRLYTLFQRAVKQGEIPALKLLTRFEIQGFKGQPRQVQNYAYTDGTAQQVSAWIERQEQTQKQNGFTVEQAQELTDAELNAAIQQQTKGSRKRKPKATKTTKKPASTNEEKTPEPIH